MANGFKTKPPYKTCKAVLAAGASHVTVAANLKPNKRHLKGNVLAVSPAICIAAPKRKYVPFVAKTTKFEKIYVNLG
jgi:hypothetical protein